MSEVKDRIKEARRRAGLTQAALGDRLGRSKGAISQWETGLGVPDYQALGKLCELSGLTADYIVRGKAAATPQDADSLEVAIGRRLLRLPIEKRLQLLGRLMELEGAVAAGNNQGLRSPNEYPQSHPFRQEADLWKQFSDPGAPSPAQSRQGGE